MDRVYKGDIPAARRALEQLKEEFSGHAERTDWVSLRIEPLLEHVKRLERLLRSARFSRETSRLPRGVSMFRSDLIYFRENIRTLKTILRAENAPDARGRSKAKSVANARLGGRTRSGRGRK